MVQALSRRMLSEPRDAEDAAQQALLNLFSRASEFDPSRDALPWILAITANECRTLRKRTMRRREDLIEPDVAGEEAESAWRTAEVRSAVEAVIGTLDARDAETLRLAMDDRPAGATFRKRLERAIVRFRARWRTQHG